MGFQAILRSFAADERGAMTFWLLIWSIVFIGFAGLAVDVANAYRTRAMLQATADAASHAGVIELVQPFQFGGSSPASDAAIKAASMAYAETNMPSQVHGTVLIETDVQVGHWDGATFSTDPTLVKNAVRAVARRENRGNGNTSDDNPLPTSLLRIVDLDSWQVAAAAVATYAGEACSSKANMILSMGQVTSTANWQYNGDLCVHGEEGISMTSNNVLQTGNKVRFSMYNTADAPGPGQISLDHGWYDNDCDGCDAEGVKQPSTAVNFVDDDVNIIARHVGFAGDFFDGDFGAPMTLAVGPGQLSKNEAQAAFAAAVTAAAATDSPTAFHFTCTSNGGSTPTIQLDQFGANPAVLENVTVYSGPVAGDTNAGACNFSASGVRVEATTIVTTSTSTTAIQLTGQPAVTGSATCQAYDEGLRLWSYGGVQVTAEADFPTIQILSGGDVDFSAKLRVEGSIEIVALGDVKLTSAGSGTSGGVMAPVCGFQPGKLVPDPQNVYIVN